jgi:hypothetical protein
MSSAAARTESSLSDEHNDAERRRSRSFATAARRTWRPASRHRDDRVAIVERQGLDILEPDRNVRMFVWRLGAETVEQCHDDRRDACRDAIMVMTAVPRGARE